LRQAGRSGVRPQPDLPEGKDARWRRAVALALAA